LGTATLGSQEPEPRSPEGFERLDESPGTAVFCRSYVYHVEKRVTPWSTNWVDGRSKSAPARKSPPPMVPARQAGARPATTFRQVPPARRGHRKSFRPPRRFPSDGQMDVVPGRRPDGPWLTGPRSGTVFRVERRRAPCAGGKVDPPEGWPADVPELRGRMGHHSRRAVARRSFRALMPWCSALRRRYLIRWIGRRVRKEPASPSRNRADEPFDTCREARFAKLAQGPRDDPPSPCDQSTSSQYGLDTREGGAGGRQGTGERHPEYCRRRPEVLRDEGAEPMKTGDTASRPPSTLGTPRCAKNRGSSVRAAVQQATQHKGQIALCFQQRATHFTRRAPDLRSGRDVSREPKGLAGCGDRARDR